MKIFKALFSGRLSFLSHPPNLQFSNLLPNPLPNLLPSFLPNLLFSNLLPFLLPAFLPTLLLVLLLIPGHPANAQVSPASSPRDAISAPSAGSSAWNKQHFLWFTGHWSPSKKNVFIFQKTAGPSGSDSVGGGGTGSGGMGSGGTGSGTITVDPDGTAHVQGGGLDEWNKKIDAGIQQLDQWIQQMGDPANNSSPPDQHLNDHLLPDAQEQKQLWEDYRIDPKQDLFTPDTRPAGNQGNAKSSAADNSNNSGAPNSNPSGTNNSGASAAPQPARTMAQVAADFCMAGKADYDAVIGFYKAHPKYNDADLHVPPPPEFEYNCYVCDSNIRKTYDTTIAHYVRDFVHPEDSLLRKGLGLMRSFQLLGGTEQGAIPEDIASAFEKSGACHYFSPGDLNEAVLGIARHVYFRAEKLVTKYRKDIRAVQAIARTYLSVARDYILLTGNVGAEDPYMEELTGLLAKTFDFYLTRLKQNDWKQVGNIPLVLGLCRQIALMGGDDGDYHFADYVKRVVPVMNGFVLSVDMDVKVGRGQGFWMSRVKGQCHIGPDFNHNANQCYTWVVLDENRKDIIGCFRSKALQEFDCDLVTNQMIMPAASPVYIGTKKYTINLEALKMDFCNPGKDTIVLSNFIPNPSNNGFWQFPHSMNQNLGITGEQFFEDMNAKKRLAESGKAQEAADKYQAQNMQLIAEMKDMQAKMQSDTGKKVFADYQKITELANKARAAATTPVMAQMLFVDFELPVQNNGQILVDKKFDAKEINPQMAPALEHAWYTIHIENKANPQKK